MTVSKNHIVIKTTKTDNVGVVVNPTGLQKGTLLKNGISLSQNIPMGHKVALKKIDVGEKIIRYGEIIGFANKPIAALTSSIPWFQNGSTNFYRK